MIQTIELEGEMRRQAQSTEDIKRCRECGLPKPISEFRRNVRSSDGYCHICWDCFSPPLPRTAMIAYPFKVEALANWTAFLRQHARRTLNRRPPSIIVTVPKAQRAELEKFCAGIEMETDAIYLMPREMRGKDRVGVVLHGCVLSGGLVIYQGWLKRPANTSQTQTPLAEVSSV